ncbi:uncharacterized protein LOC114790356 [Denticeps clupeoides]|uniref:C2H2-type domain-containing protein n=1 Tax=Denticeps clupeoides TaxID=299321 RepID=A0AAY4AFD5_9TELE|nr:uncharacterized protein LOC114790356 [Denticeps clupeoides]XP_028836183.1 uncharacterized protein LOC114790356 [Denticeps clupeoides]XP_028836184.1 uncharacterized protein LOC114790356 [Denticeps clupeoides]
MMCHNTETNIEDIGQKELLENNCKNPSDLVNEREQTWQIDGEHNDTTEGDLSALHVMCKPDLKCQKGDKTEQESTLWAAQNSVKLKRPRGRQPKKNIKVEEDRATPLEKDTSPPVTIIKRKVGRPRKLSNLANEVSKEASLNTASSESGYSEGSNQNVLPAETICHGTKRKKRKHLCKPVPKKRIAARQEETDTSRSKPRKQFRQKPNQEPFTEATKKGPLGLQEATAPQNCQQPTKSGNPKENESGESSCQADQGIPTKKRKVGRPAKRRTELARQSLALKRAANSQKSQFHQLQSSGNQGTESHVLPLRRYSRACKGNKDNVDNKDKIVHQQKQPRIHSVSDQPVKLNRSGSLFSSSEHEVGVPQPRNAKKRQVSIHCKIENSHETSDIQDSSIQQASSGTNHLVDISRPRKARKLKRFLQICDQDQTQITVMCCKSEDSQKTLHNSAEPIADGTVKTRSHQRIPQVNSNNLEEHEGKPSVYPLCAAGSQTLDANILSKKKRGRRKKIKEACDVKLEQPEESSDMNSPKCQNSLPEGSTSCTIQCEVGLKRPRKIDRRRKRFRNMKLAAPDGASGNKLAEVKQAEKPPPQYPVLYQASSHPQTTADEESVLKQGEVFTEMPSKLVRSRRRYRRKHVYSTVRRKAKQKPTVTSSVKKEQACEDGAESSTSKDFIAEALISSEPFFCHEPSPEDPPLAHPSRPLGDRKGTVSSGDVTVNKSNSAGHNVNKSEPNSTDQRSKATKIPVNGLAKSPHAADVKLPESLGSPADVLPSPGANPGATAPIKEQRHVVPVGASCTSLPDIVSEANPETGRRRRRRPGEGPLVCQYCARPFNHFSAYVIHMRVHTGEKPYGCEKCGRAFAQLSNLNAHSRVHSKMEKKLECVQSEKSDIKSEHVAPAGAKPVRKRGKPCLCHICGKEFRFRSVLKIHMRVHSGEKPYSCRVCGKAFSQACSVRVHEKIHWSVKPYVCAKCGRGFSQIGTLKTHACKAVGIHATALEQPHPPVAFQCHLCNEYFILKSEYDQHLLSHTDTDRYGCDMCGKQFSLESELSTHRLYCNDMRAEAKPLSRGPSLNTEGPCPPSHENTRVPVKCELPEVGIKKKATAAWQGAEGRTASLQRPDPRPSLLTCPSSATTPSADPLTDFAPAPAASRLVSNLNHLHQDHDPRRYFCPRCGRLFRHVGRLRAHMLTHGHNQKYSYDCCGKAFTSWSKFWHHQRVHRQRRGRFFCPKCTRGFRFASSYKEHLQEHPELNAYMCPLCPLTFSRAESLRAHQRDWHKLNLPHICDVCGKGFDNQRTLECHSIAHRSMRAQTAVLCEVELQSSVLPYECGECDSSFKSVDLLFHHQLCHGPSKDNLLLNGGRVDRDHPELRNSLSSCLPSDPAHGDPPPGTKLNRAEPPRTLFQRSAVPLHLRQPSSQSYKESNPLVQGCPTPLSVWPSSLSLSNTQSAEIKTFKPLHKHEKSPTFTNSLLDNIPSEDNILVIETRDGMRCAECGGLFSGVSELFEHYLQHARGEV